MNSYLKKFIKLFLYFTCRLSSLIYEINGEFFIKLITFYKSLKDLLDENN